MNVVGLIAPVWILVVLVGAFWTGVATVAVPPRADRFLKILIGATVGAAVGQLVGGGMSRPLLTVGDVHAVTVSVGAILAIGVVRLFSA